MYRLKNVIASVVIAAGLFAIGTSTADAQQWSSSTRQSWSSGSSSSYRSGPNGYEVNRSGYRTNSFEQQNVYRDATGTYGRKYTSDNFRDYNVTRGVNQGNPYYDRSRNQGGSRGVDTFYQPPSYGYRR